MSVGCFRPGAVVQVPCQNGQVDRALDVLDQQGTVPSLERYASLLMACEKSKSLAQTKLVHAHLVRHGLEGSRSLGEQVLQTLVKCGGLEEANQVFQRMPQKTVVSWTAMISGCTKAQQFREALMMYQQMREEGVAPQRQTLMSVLQACGSMTDLNSGKLVHADVVKHRFESDLIVSTCVVHMYAKCGNLVAARRVFDTLWQRDVVAWNAMLAAYAQQGQGEMALQLFRKMQEEGVAASDRTFVSALQACGSVAENEENTVVDGLLLKVRALKDGRALQAEAQRWGYDADMYVASALVSMYAKCGSIKEARLVFDGLSRRDVVSWTAMLSAYAQQGQAEEALQLYERMKVEKVRFDARSFVNVIQACGILAEKEEDAVVVDGHLMKLKSLSLGRAIHDEALRRGHGSYVFLGNALVSMYGKCGSIVEARKVFDKMLRRDVVSWNAMIAACAQQQLPEEALQVYGQMESGVSPNVFTFVSVLQACSCLADKETRMLVAGLSITTLESLQMGKAIHAEARRRGYESDVLVASALVNMYGKCGSILEAQDVFDSLPQRDMAVWNAMLAAYTQQGQAEKALKLFEQMEEGLSPNEITYMCILQACGLTGALDICVEIHANLVSSSRSGLNLSVANTLIDAFSKCASMEDARAVFDALPQPDVVSWNALIAGYAREGDLDKSLERYEEMQVAGVKPDRVTFLSLLSACSHGGMVARGVAYFESMTTDFGIPPGVEHFVSMVDLLGRAGYFGMVELLLSEMPTEPNAALWLCLLACCRKHGNVELGRRAFNCAVDLQPEQAGAYVLMASIYANAGMWQSASKLDQMREKRGGWKRPEPGQTWIKHEKDIHTFTARGCKHLQQNPLYDLLQEL